MRRTINITYLFSRCILHSWFHFLSCLFFANFRTTTSLCLLLPAILLFWLFLFLLLGFYLIYIHISTSLLDGNTKWWGTGEIRARRSDVEWTKKVRKSPSKNTIPSNPNVRAILWTISKRSQNLYSHLEEDKAYNFLSECMGRGVCFTNFRTPLSFGFMHEKKACKKARYNLHGLFGFTIFTGTNDAILNLSVLYGDIVADGGHRVGGGPIHPYRL